MIYKQPVYGTQKLFGEVYLAGQKISFKEWSVDLCAFDEADNFDVIVPWNVGGNGILASNAKASTTLISGKDIPVQIKIGNRELINGIVDEPDWDFTDEEKVMISGRGKIGRLIDREIPRNIKNRTASSVANEIFAYHKLKAKVTATSRKIGSYSEDSQTANTKMNDWELLNWLAEWEGFVVRVKGNEGFFGPLDQIPELKLAPIPFTYGKDCEVRSIKRHMSGARDIIVEGRSYYKGRTIIEYYPRPPKENKKGASNDEPETALIKRYTLTGLSQEQVRLRIRSIYRELTKCDITGEIFTPRYVDLDTDRRIALYGVGLGLSQIYYVTRVRYSETLEDGITTTISFGNKMKEVG
ncbi:hypothetical protein ACKE5C_19090 (plasmid) [Aneurinibacillus thermoaerophilus]|uniref:Phage protein D n=1 Tax=Aneurinibacillus thermoaerophilus TaxID=143495 RepID=A0ABX8YGN1_ANETH|nr:hypothetical protein [Aneurinibacillus thermoaerophilus]QYY44787.1 hypothetical protein K3F53_18810 [Aneurinibacillus thermoaerophilus]